MQYVNIRFKKQKNDRNMEIIPYAKDFKNPSLCPVCAALRIIQRAIRLQVPAEEPIGCYFATTGKHTKSRCFITADQVADYLRETAIATFGIKRTDKKALERWSSHSIRVTACNLLHRQGMSDTYIQIRLRWTSKAFLEYLRNTLYNAEKHTMALTIPENNLPRLSSDYLEVPRPGVMKHYTNALAGNIVERHRGLEELEQVLHARAA